MSLPKFLQTAPWSYDLKTLDIKKDRHLIITQILNHGTWEQVQWVLKNYREREIKEVVKNPDRGVWHKDALNFWLNIFNLKLPKKIIKDALFSLKVK
ncbi:MAG: hypothetical protein AB1465_07345 [Patescibacteria group bacterium]